MSTRTRAIGAGDDYDVVVVGGGMAGMCAAIAARREGCSVLLVERSNLLGGCTTLSMVQPWQSFHAPPAKKGDLPRPIVGGIAQEFVDELAAIGACRGHVADPIGFAATLTPVDITLLPLYLAEKLEREGIEFLLGWRVAEVRCRKNRLLRIRLHSPCVEPEQVREIRGRTFVDATGSAGLLRLAGEETYAPSRPQAWTHIFSMAPVQQAEVIDFIARHPRDFVLAKDWQRRMQKYLAVSGFFSLVRRARGRGQLQLPRDRLLFFGTLDRSEVVVNSTRVAPGYRYFRRPTPERMEIAGQLRTEALAQVRVLARWMRENVPGFAHAELHRLAAEVGVRESFRLQGRYRLSGRDVVEGRSFKDSIALGAYPVDVHLSGTAALKTRQLGKRGLYEIPLRCLQPRRIGNILVAGRCLSADSTAYASARVTPIAMALGQAAGMAAGMLAHDERPNTKRILAAVSGGAFG